MNKLFVLLALFAVYAVVFPTSSYAVTGSDIKFNFRLNKTNAKMNDSITGMWGGKHISIEIMERGAKIEYDCAHASIDKKIVLDKKKHFDVPGTYVEEHGGPARENDAPNSYPARFIGRIKGKRMTLVVKRKDNNKVIGTFSLLQGQESLLVKCR